MKERDRGGLLTAEDAPCVVNGIKDSHDHEMKRIGRRKWELGERHRESLHALSHEELPPAESSKVEPREHTRMQRGALRNIRRASYRRVEIDHSRLLRHRMTLDQSNAPQPTSKDMIVREYATEGAANDLCVAHL